MKTKSMGGSTRKRFKKLLIDIYGLECFYCKTKLSNEKVQSHQNCLPKNYATIDHIHPRCKGGKHELKNLVLCCHKCNLEKADLGFYEFIFKVKSDRLITKLRKFIRLFVKFDVLRMEIKKNRYLKNNPKCLIRSKKYVENLSESVL